MPNSKIQCDYKIIINAIQIKFSNNKQNYGKKKECIMCVHFYTIIFKRSLPSAKLCIHTSGVCLVICSVNN